MTAILPTTHARLKSRVMELTAMVDLIDGETLAAEIRATAERLAELMQAIHGGDWRLRINHDTCYVTVSRDFTDEPEEKPC